MKIGFIGMGIMGKPMAMNLVKAGFDVTVANRTVSKCDEVVAAGAKAGTYQSIAESCDLIITMLPNSPEVKSVVLAESFFAALHPGQILVDTSSINPIDSREIAAKVAEKGVEMLDAPVSGGEPMAISGNLSFMVGGKQEIFDTVKPILLHMGASAVRCGDIGAGNTTKLANQIIVACNIEALAEAMTLAKKAGVDPQLVFEAIRGGLAGSNVMNAKAPMMIDGNDKPGFKVDLHIKDLTNAISCAHTVGVPVPMTASVMEVLQWLHQNGGGEKDHSAIAQYYENLANIKIGNKEESN